MPPKTRRGQPTKLTPEVQENILDGVRLGLSYERAAIRAGIEPRIFNRWMQWGRERKSGIFTDFCQDLKKAEIDGEAVLLARIHEHSKKKMPGQWVAAAWILERRHRNLWAAPKAQEVQQTVAPDDTARWASSPKEAGLDLPGGSESESDSSHSESDDPLSKDDA